jgi:hypothetical protein
LHSSIHVKRLPLSTCASILPGANALIAKSNS